MCLRVCVCVFWRCWGWVERGLKLTKTRKLELRKELYGLINFFPNRIFRKLESGLNPHF